MLKTRLLHPEILAALAASGHFSQVLVADGNFPVAGNRGPNAHVVHLNLTPGTLDAITVLDALLDDPKRPWKSAAFSQYPRNAGKTGAGELMGYTMRTDRYRFTNWTSKTDHSKVDATELYDHQTDPQENVNIAKDPANAELSSRSSWRNGIRAGRVRSRRSQPNPKPVYGI